MPLNELYNAYQTRKVIPCRICTHIIDSFWTLFHKSSADDMFMTHDTGPFKRQFIYNVKKPVIWSTDRVRLSYLTCSTLCNL